MGNETTNIIKQNQACNGYYVVSELNNVLKSGYYEPPLGLNNVFWFVTEVIKQRIFTLAKLRKTSYWQRLVKKLLKVITISDFVRKNIFR